MSKATETRERIMATIEDKIYKTRQRMNRNRRRNRERERERTKVRLC